MIGIDVLRDPAQAAALLEPGSASGVARRPRLPRQQVNYHLRELEKSGVVEFVEERRKGNCLERMVQAEACSYPISPDPSLRHDCFSAAYLLPAAARAHRAGKRLATLTFETEVRFADAPARSAFAGELADAITHLVAKYNTDAPGSRPFRLFLGAYPAITKPKSKGTGE
jgi:hypothetical protein